MSFKPEISPASLLNQLNVCELVEQVNLIDLFTLGKCFIDSGCSQDRACRSSWLRSFLAFAGAHTQLTIYSVRHPLQSFSHRSILQQFRVETIRLKEDRRVTELLAEHIPEDEAKLLSNGRYTCLVCHDRPVVDTLAILSQHRVGKKHRFYLAKFMERKEETERLILKRKQETYLLNGTTDSGDTLHPDRVLGQATARGLLKTSSTYDRKSKTKYKPYSRKVVLEFDRQEKNSTEKMDNPREPANPKTQVNKYIRQSQRKRDFTDVVEAKRKLTVTPCNSDSTYAPKLETPKNIQSDKPESSSKVLEPKEIDQRTKYYQNLRASGWKKDLLGNWVRDDDAEFDSDEEPPEEYEVKVK